MANGIEKSNGDYEKNVADQRKKAETQRDKVRKVADYLPWPINTAVRSVIKGTDEIEKPPTKTSY